MRKLATIRKVREVIEIPKAENICLVLIDGWQCVAQKGEFAPGDLCCYVEVDSILPDKPCFEFMRPRKFRVKTIKCMKQLSQGLAKPLSLLKEFSNKQFVEGDDVTDIIGVTKHDPEADQEAKITRPKDRMKWWQRWLAKVPLIGRMYRRQTGAMPFPVHICSKTDEERYQNINPRILESWNNQPLEITEKLDGTSATYIYKPKAGFFTPEQFMVCSRNQMLDKPDSSVYWEIANKLDLRSKMAAMHKAMSLKSNDYLIIQGEILAPNVQGNKYGVTESRLFVFNLKTCNEKTREAKQYDHFDIRRNLNQFKLDEVPLLLEQTGIVSEIVKEMQKNNKSTIADTIAEGFVVRLQDQNAGGLKSFKYIHPEFLLKHGL